MGALGTSTIEEVAVALFLPFSWVCTRGCIGPLMTERQHVGMRGDVRRQACCRAHETGASRPRRGPRNVFVWSHVFVTFAKVGYFHCKHLLLLFFSPLTSLLLFLPTLTSLVLLPVMLET